MTIEQSTLDEIARVFKEQWCADYIVTRGRVHTSSSVRGLSAYVDGKLVGLVTYCIRAEECEMVSLDSFSEGIGIGSALIARVMVAARQNYCRRVFLITTNDNTQALKFYQKRGFSLVAVHRNALEESRRLKPSIPAIGMDGIRIQHEIEMEIVL